VTDTPARLLTLLSLLQTPREWPGSELATRLGVSLRTIRRDVDRLRDLGYPVEASMGALGGYRRAGAAAHPSRARRRPLRHGEDVLARPHLHAMAARIGRGAG
jgi:predicted DNA-binding transcriptional regulator YafY